MTYLSAILMQTNKLWLTELVRILIGASLTLLYNFIKQDPIIISVHGSKMYTVDTCINLVV